MLFRVAQATLRNFEVAACYPINKRASENSAGRSKK